MLCENVSYSVSAKTAHITYHGATPVEHAVFGSDVTVYLLQLHDICIKI